MQQTTRIIQKRKNIALVAHDHRKKDLLEWVIAHRDILQKHNLFATGTTGYLLEEKADLKITKMISGPMGGDQQIGAKISEQGIDMMIFLWDPLNAVPHDPDVKALLRISTVWNIPVANNRATAEFLLSSPLMNDEIKINIPDYKKYLAERI